MMWGPSRQCGDDGDNMWRPDHGDHMGTFWGLLGQHEDDGDNGDDGNDVGMMWG